MMIKLFLITLLCVVVIANSQEDQMNEMGTGLRKVSADMAEHTKITGQNSPLLMQDMAQARNSQRRPRTTRRRQIHISGRQNQG
ncbi:PREDICTED: uncharacterized protein LOC108756816 isoform X2 [Trachymyrmex septentrionalis]|uniref:uncharacterized protein LOC108756816 isoform X2 n=1 Tax=Trachymyrmex septentrionalis TaxID=34720 RepID=UPI00084F2FF3|nr:PREDICTED: uncharacterized protein LOC108756816 isoform X2 [Trachymyrmex septentrionalis]